MPSFPSLRAFLEELGEIKTAAVRGPVKQYRRTLEALRGNTAYHGVNHPEARLPNIIREGQIRPGFDLANPGATNVGSHGPGAYLWNQHGPQLTYMHHANAAGIHFPHPEPGTYQTPTDPNPGHAMRKFMTVWQHRGDNIDAPTTPLKLPPKSTVVAPPHLLGGGPKIGPVSPEEAGFREHRLRRTDSAIFNRAEADRRARIIKQETGYGDGATPPTKQELVRLAKRKVAPARFRTMRGHLENDQIGFAEHYPTAIGR